MTTVLIGHRGVGKTLLLRRIKDYLGSDRVRVFDLDAEIEKGEEQSISQIFESQQEVGFRKIENQYFDRIFTKECDPSKLNFIAVGAGFSGFIPENIKCLWIRRPTDSNGRIFLDRPRLESNCSPIDEYLQRYREREAHFKVLADYELTLFEGDTNGSPAEELYFTHSIQNLGGLLTLLPGHEGSELKEFLHERLSWGVDRIELRDDLLSKAQLEQALRDLPPERTLFSFRARKPQNVHFSLEQMLWDWPVELGPCSKGQPPIVSLHDRQPNETLIDALHRLESMGGKGFLKASPEVMSFSELWIGHEWALHDLKNRSFLPRSPTGRWRWYRLLMKNRFRLNFFREGHGSALDQPYLMEWISQSFSTGWFAAVLGDPVEHSLTPSFHRKFFAELGLPVVRIPISVAEWQSGGFEILNKLGLRFAAVTSPLKSVAYQNCIAVEEKARKFQAANTLRWTPNGWHGTNTDEDGLRAALAGIDSSKTCVWGGGGTLGPLIAVIPDANLYSARTGQPRDPTRLTIGPEFLIWAVGPEQMPSCRWPPHEWRPRVVLDLNYAENSPGREYALRCKAEYLSGLTMFRVQAEKQQLFWRK